MPALEYEETEEFPVAYRGFSLDLNEVDSFQYFVVHKKLYLSNCETPPYLYRKPSEVEKFFLV